MPAGYESDDEEPAKGTEEDEDDDLPELDEAEEEKLKNDESLKWDEDEEGDKDDEDGEKKKDGDKDEDDEDDEDDDDEDEDDKKFGQSPLTSHRMVLSRLPNFPAALRRAAGRLCHRWRRPRRRRGTIPGSRPSTSAQLRPGDTMMVRCSASPIPHQPRARSTSRASSACNTSAPSPPPASPPPNSRRIRDAYITKKFSPRSMSR